MSNRHQELARLEQTASDKDFSNLLMADSLPKPIWFSTHHASHLDLSILTTTLNRLERSIQTGINNSCTSLFSLSERLQADNKSPTIVLFDDDTGSISIRHFETKEYHSECSGKISRIMRRTL
ncbi:hypothetical protein Tco_0201354 [Tanacetum coccineum]